jgi:hypothetical protein
MNKFVMTLPLIGLLAGCNTLNQPLNDGQVLGTATGAVIGAAVTPNNRTEGALLGAAAGLVATSLVGQTPGGECVYRRQDGSQFIGPC